MVLEDRGVKKETLIDLQDAKKALIYLSRDSLENFIDLLKSESLGGKFHLPFILEQLSVLGLDFKDSRDKKAIGSAFFGRLLRFSMSHSLRQMKFKARIPVPRSYQLVGVADEGQAYINEGANPDDVFTLGEGRIYGTILLYHRATLFIRRYLACVQGPADKDPVYFKGTCLISRSPVMHPGDGM
jgi:RNA-dependent RNA polymerase